MSSISAIVAVIGIGLYIAILAVGCLFSATAYIVQGLSFMKISKKLGIDKGWLGWIPYANYYLLGKFAEKDDEIYGKDGKHLKWSQILLWTGIGFAVLTVVYLIASLLLVLIPVIGTILDILLSIVFILLSIAVAIVTYIGYYKLFHLMVPKHAWWQVLLMFFTAQCSAVVSMAVFAFSKKFPTYLRTDDAEEASAE